MKIKQLRINNYGPLKDKYYHFSNGFNLIYGENERGKSLTFDALVKLLFGKQSKQFDQINRVEENPADFGGFVELELHPNSQSKDKKLEKIQGKPSLPEITNLSAEECQNLFLIRNSNLSIGQDLEDQDRFYTSLTDRLTGLQTKEISQAREKILNYAQLTDTYRFQSTQENLKLGDRIEQIKTLVSDDGKIGQTLKQDEQQNWSNLETQLWQLTQYQNEIQREIEEQKQAKSYQEFLVQKKNLDELQKLDHELSLLNEITQENLDKLRMASQENKRLAAQEIELKTELTQKQKKQDSIEKQLLDITKKIEKLSPLKVEIEESIQPEAILLNQKISSARAIQEKPWKQLLMLIGSLLLISIIALLIKPLLVITIVAAGLFLLTIFLSLKNITQLNSQQQLDKKFHELKLRLEKFNITINAPEEIGQKTTLTKQQFNELSAQKSYLTVEKKALRDDIELLRDKRLSQIHADLVQQQEIIKQIQQDCKLDSSEQLKEKLQKKHLIESEKQRALTLLESQLGKPSFGLDPISHFKQRLASHPATLMTGQRNTKFHQARLLELEQEQSKSLEKSQQMRQQLTELKDVFADLQRQINSLWPEREHPFVIDNLNDLKQARQELVVFANTHLHKRQHAVKLHKLLEEAEIEEKEKVSSLFGEKSKITRFFQIITQNKYSCVYYDQSQHQVMVEKKGQHLKASQLSSGTYDQLYFSIRFGLADKLLEGKTGFFVMDDPFLKSDQIRLEQQLDMLLQLADQDWQIIYFTAKNEVKHFLDKKNVQLLTLS